jgi:phosphoribosylformylglycinamidine synthase
MKYRIHLQIVPRKGLLDPHGKAVADALHSLNFAQVTDVRIGRHIVIDLAATDAFDAERQVREMCDKLLANPVTEDYAIAGVEAL